MTKFEWDESKQATNLEKHGIDFVAARDMFDGRDVYTRSSWRDGEARYATTCYLGTVMFTAIWTMRDTKIRLISVRRARDAEEREYRQLHRR
jgi:uncharacterized DUF497 family protein